MRRSGAIPAGMTARGIRPDWHFIVGNTIGLFLATVIAAASLWPVYESREFIVLVGVTFGLGAAIAILGALFRWGTWLVALAAVGVYLLAGVPLAVPGQAVRGILPSPGGFLDLLAATALSWKQLVTIVLPVGSYQALLVPAFVLVLLSTVIGLSVALRAPVGELGTLAPAGLFVIGIILGPTVTSMPIGTGLGLFVVLLFWLLWFRWMRRRSLRLALQQSRGSRASSSERRLTSARGLVSASVIVLVAIFAGTGAAILLPADVPRDVLRARVQQPFDPRDYPSPLSEFRAYLQTGRADAVLLKVAGLPIGGRLRLATLDSYDGIVYSVGSDQVDSASGSFTRLPDRLDQSLVDGTEATLTVTVEGYTGVWVPGAGQLERITFTGPTRFARSDSFYYNDNGGTAAVLTGLVRGDSYRSAGVIPRAPDSLADLRPGSAALPPLAVLPDELEQAHARYVRAGDPPGVQLQAMLDGLRTDGYISHGILPDEPVSRSGHGADRVSELFTDQPMLGDAEQYAVAAALMARRIGFPARVVIGFIPQTAGTSAAEAVPVIGSDISAWIEVASTGGWVAIDPTPPVRDIPAKAPENPSVVSRPQSVVPPALPDPAELRDLAPPESLSEEPPAPPDPFLAFLIAAATVAAWLLLGLGVLLSPFLLVILAKARRRHLRRTRSTPLDRIRGGWREFSDAALDHGIDVPAGVTRSELAALVPGTEPRTVAGAVAVAVDRAVFSPERPGSAAAEEVWSAVTALRRSLGAGSRRTQRLRALVSLRSLGRYAGGASSRRRIPRGSGRAQGGTHP